MDNKNVATGLLFDERYLEHKTGKGHPECPERLQATYRYLQKLPWFSKLKAIKPKSADESWIRTTHSQAYINHAKEVCESGFAYLDTQDVGVSKKSFEIAKLAVGGALAVADNVIQGDLTNGFALLRPPGHHAEEDLAMGFCLLNNVAIVARYLQKKHNLDKVLIFDWDVHHGNGTQHSFEEDPSVFYVSLHQYPFYPGTGAATETGRGKGKDATLNCPMPAGALDQDYEKAFCETILPKIDEFKPNTILISAGFDAHQDDPLADVRLTTPFYGWMTERMMEIADKYSGGRIISLLEGGYNLEALPRCIATHLAVLSGSED